MKKILHPVVTIILVLVVFFLLFELALRLFWQMSGLKGELYQKSANKVLRYEFKPRARLDIPGHYEGVVINSDGFRGPEYPLKKEKGLYRVVMIGDSVTFSRLTKWEDSLAQKLEEGLSAGCPGKRFEVLNMGVEGYNSIQELELLKVKALKYDPDLVIVYYCFNDPDSPEYYFKKNFINRHSLLARYILYRMKKHRIKSDRLAKGIKSDEDNYRYFYSTQCWQDAKDAVLEMGDLTNEAGIKMVLLVVTELSLPVKDFREGYPFGYIHQILAREIRHENIVIIDSLEEFSRINPDISTLRVWTYPNSKANDLIAAYAIKKLKEDNINFCN
ncbi:MAG: SGNH/GDSL hydrolase family protein [Candidatus Omnitrophota bacterium]